jgi:hypothetical protein
VALVQKAGSPERRLKIDEAAGEVASEALENLSLRAIRHNTQTLRYYIVGESAFQDQFSLALVQLQRNFLVPV